MKRLPTKKSIALGTLAAGAVTVAFSGSASALLGGLLNLTGGFVEPMDPTWFDGTECRDAPITLDSVPVAGIGVIDQYVVDVAAVRDDGEPKTFVRCVLDGEQAINRCMVGLADNNVVFCEDETAPHYLPNEGDILYMSMLDIDGNDEFESCEISVGTHDRFGEADPKCRQTGCTPLPTNVGTDVEEGQCYSFDTGEGTLQLATWHHLQPSGAPGPGFTVNATDDAGNSVSQYISHGGVYKPVNGLENGVVNFTVQIDGAATTTKIWAEAW